jgi:hypothetical protein
LEAARAGGRRPTIIFCSTNKVYGDNVNAIGVAQLILTWRCVEKLEHLLRP